LKITLGLLLVPRGFEARYYANPDFSGTVESSVESPARGVTRIDHRLRFGFDRAPDVPLPFFNELRFNYYKDTEPDRKTLPFSVAWQGIWHAPGSGPQQLYAHTPDGPVTLTIGDRLSTRIDPTDAWHGVVDLPPGDQRVTISWSVAQGAARRLDIGRVTDKGEEPFDAAIVLRERAGTVRRAADAVLRGVTRVLDALLLIWLAVRVWSAVTGAWTQARECWDVRSFVALAWFAGLVDAFIFALPSLARMVTLSGGDDWLTYESEARDIAMHGLWMNEGAPLGHGAAFYGQPLYSYFLAACHWLFGDGLFGIFLVQRLLVAATVIALWRTAALLFDEWVGAAALVTAIVVVYEKLAGWSGILLTETLFTPLVCTWVYLLVRLGARSSDPRRIAIVAGVVGGLATLARSSLLLAWVAVVLLLPFAIPRGRHRIAAIALMVSAMVAVSSLATIRNWVVSRQFVLISSEGPVVLFLGNSPPPLEIPPDYKARYERLHLDPRIQAVAEYARQQPGAFARGLGRKARFTLGWFEEFLPGAGTSAFYIAMWLLTLAAIPLLWWLRPVSLPLALIPLLIASTHFAAVVLFQPHVYGDRLIMPLYVVLVPIVVVPVALIARACVRRGRGRTAAALCGALLVVAVARILSLILLVDVDVFAVAVATAGLCLMGVPRLRGSWTLACAIYVIAVAVWFVWTPTNASALTLRQEIVFVALALLSPALLGDTRGRRTVGAVIIGMVVVGAALLARFGVPPNVMTEITKSLRNAYGYTAALCAPAGLAFATLFLVVPRRLTRVRRAVAYTAAALMTIPALQWAGAMVNPQRAILNNQLATIGVVGALAYAALWLHSAWPSGRTTWSPAWSGAALGVFLTAVFGASIAHAGAALPIVAGLLIGVIQAERAESRIG